MPTTTATISGSFADPLLAGKTFTAYVEPNTLNGLLTLSGQVIAGRARVDFTAGSATISLPTTDQAGIGPSGVKWRLVIPAAVLGRSDPVASIFALTGNTTWDALVVSTVGPYTDSLVGYATTAAAQAQASAAAAAASASTATSVSGITTTDAAVAALVRNAASTTRGAMANLRPVRSYQRSAQAQVVFTFDDSPAADFSIVKPILDAKGIKGTFCVLTGSVGAAGNMTWAQITTLAGAGHELVAHSRTHANLAGVTAATLASEITGSFTDITTNTGITPRGFCWPVNSHDAAARAVAASAGEFAIGSGTTGNNSQPFKSYGIARQTILNGGTLAAYKVFVDTAVTNKQMVVFLVHSGYDLDATQQTILGQLIDYIVSLAVPIRTMSDAFDRMGNYLEVGDFFGGTIYAVVGGDGHLYSSDLAARFGALNPAVTDAPSTYAQNAVTIQAVQAASGGSYPGSTSGVLETINAGQGSSYFVKQVWRNAVNRVYERSGDGATGWQAWSETTPGASPVTVDVINSHLATALPSTFAVGVTINEINNASSTGTPTGTTGGTLVTTKMQDVGWSFQEFQQYNSNTRHRRGQNATGDAWLAWVAYA